MGAEVKAVGTKKRMWGTWEELILGAAVLRHGCEDWNVVASELRPRTLAPSYFTPEVCKAKYKELRKRYSGCTAWFEELRKQRIAELKRGLEKSEDSIGSLETKMRNLKSQDDCMSSRAQSPASILRSDGNESFGKDTSKDGLSAGSFTQDTRTKCAPECQLPAVESAVANTSKLEISVSSELKAGLNVTEPAEPSSTQCGTPRKRRGKRRRKDCGKEVKEGSLGESDNLCSTNVVSTSNCNETSTSECGQINQFSPRDGPNPGARKTNTEDLMEVFDSFLKNKAALIFRHRLDSQKRARYKRVIKQHRDFEMIKSRILSHSIRSTSELFLDLLLLASNAMVFYSKRTKEHKSARSLRDAVLKACRQDDKIGSCSQDDKIGSCSKAISPRFPLASMYNPPVKPRSARPRSSKHNIPVKKIDNADNTRTASPRESLKKTDEEENFRLKSLLRAKKDIKKPGRMKNGLVKRTPPKAPVLKEKKGGRQS